MTPFEEESWDHGEEEDDGGEELEERFEGGPGREEWMRGVGFGGRGCEDVVEHSLGEVAETGRLFDDGRDAGERLEPRGQFEGPGEAMVVEEHGERYEEEEGEGG